VTRRFFVIVFLLIVAVIVPVPVAAAQASESSSSSSSAAKPVDVSGKWQVAWQGRLGTEQCTLQLQQDSSNKLKGTLQDLHGISPLSGTIDGKKVVFDVTIQGSRPFTTQFTGTVDADKIKGTSQAINVGGAGAFLGHGGEVVQPEHPWTAKRVADQPAQSNAGSNQNPPARN
jgi:opacity protein-like surface antigen